jgi:hypothetical protein
LRRRTDRVEDGAAWALTTVGLLVKDYWWYLDAVPSHAWNRWRYHPTQSLRFEGIAGLAVCERRLPGSRGP